MANDDFVSCPHCGHEVNYGGLIGEFTNDCPKCGKPVLTEEVENA